MSFQGRATFDYREILRVLARRRLLIVLPALVTIVAAVVGVSLMQPMYSSTATLAHEGSVGLTRTVAAAAAPSERRNDRAHRKNHLLDQQLQMSWLGKLQDALIRRQTDALVGVR